MTDSNNSTIRQRSTVQTRSWHGSGERPVASEMRGAYLPTPVFCRLWQGVELTNTP